MLDATVRSTGPKNPPVATLVYLDQNGNGVGMGTVLPAGKDTITAFYGPYATATRTFTVTPAPLVIAENSAYSHLRSDLRLISPDLWVRQ